LALLAAFPAVKLVAWLVLQPLRLSSTGHHIVCDGLSLGCFIHKSNLCAFYSGWNFLAPVPLASSGQLCGFRPSVTQRTNSAYFAMRAILAHKILPVDFPVLVPLRTRRLGLPGPRFQFHPRTAWTARPLSLRPRFEGLMVKAGFRFFHRSSRCTVHALVGASFPGSARFCDSPANGGQPVIVASPIGCSTA